jgi:uncharacterized protein Yka (UPF0111/DUF47 family)
MISLRRIFGRDEKFYDLLEASAAEAKNSAALLVSLLEEMKTNSEPSLTEIAQSRRKHKKITQEITEQICRNFVTPLEREDIEALSSSLYRIPKNIEKIAQRLLICPLDITWEPVVKQAALLEQGADTVVLMVRQLRSNSHGEQIQKNYERLQTIEGEADELITNLLRDLYRGSADARAVIILKDLYELVERVIDRCRDAGNVVFQVVLKYS